jgi:CRP/FNR family cyclic AMP-dependent transcriptional regulator
MVKLKAEHVSFFGDMAMFQDEPRSATITASMDCTLYEITRDSFTKFCDDFPEQGVKVLQRIASTMAGRVRKGNEDILKLTTALSMALS